MDDFFLQIILFLLGLAIQIFLQINQGPDHKTLLRRILRATGILLIFVSLVWAGIAITNKIVQANTPSVEITSPKNDQLITIVQTAEQEVRGWGSFEVSGKYSKVAINERSRIFVVGTNIERKPITIYFTAVNETDGTWDTNIIAGDFQIGTEYFLYAIVCDPADVMKFRQPDGSYQPPNVELFNPKLQSKEIRVYVGAIVNTP